MRTSAVHAALLIAMLTLTVGCGKPASEPPLTTTTLEALYPGDIHSSDRIDIRSGSTGELRSYTEPATVQTWIEQAGKLPFAPDPNQEGRVGFTYSVTLYEGSERKLSFTPNSIGGHYYLENESLAKLLAELFASPPSP